MRSGEKRLQRKKRLASIDHQSRGWETQKENHKPVIFSFGIVLFFQSTADTRGNRDSGSSL
jgi:hypothetical protein